MKLLHALVISLIAVFAPAKAVISTVFVLCLVDLLTGLLVSRKANIPITSAGLKRSVLKMAMYELAVLLGFLVEQYLTQGSLPVLNIISSMIGLTELKSVLENLNVLSGGDVLKAILAKLNAPNQ